MARCEATTSKGARCKLKARDGGKFCHLHDPDDGGPDGGLSNSLVLASLVWLWNEGAEGALEWYQLITTIIRHITAEQGEFDRLIAELQQAADATGDPALDRASTQLVKALEHARTAGFKITVNAQKSQVKIERTSSRSRDSATGQFIGERVVAARKRERRRRRRR